MRQLTPAWARKMQARSSRAIGHFQEEKANAITKGHHPNDAGKLALEALSPDEVEAIKFSDWLNKTFQSFSVKEEFMAGYDAHTLVLSLSNVCRGLTGTSPPPLLLLEKMFGYGQHMFYNDDRPPNGAISQTSPLDALRFLYDVAAHSNTDEATYMACYLDQSYHHPTTMDFDMLTAPVLYDQTGNVHLVTDAIDTSAIHGSSCQ